MQLFHSVIITDTNLLLTIDRTQKLMLDISIR